MDMFSLESQSNIIQITHKSIITLLYKKFSKGLSWIKVRKRIPTAHKLEDLFKPFDNINKNFANIFWPVFIDKVIDYYQNINQQIFRNSSQQSIQHWSHILWDFFLFSFGYSLMKCRVKCRSNTSIKELLLPAQIIVADSNKGKYKCLPVMNALQKLDTHGIIDIQSFIDQERIKSNAVETHGKCKTHKKVAKNVHRKIEHYFYGKYINFLSILCQTFNVNINENKLMFKVLENNEKFKYFSKEDKMFMDMFELPVKYQLPTIHELLFDTGLYSHPKVIQCLQRMENDGKTDDFQSLEKMVVNENELKINENIIFPDLDFSSLPLLPVISPSESMMNEDDKYTYNSSHGTSYEDNRSFYHPYIHQSHGESVNNCGGMHAYDCKSDGMFNGLQDTNSMMDKSMFVSNMNENENQLKNKTITKAMLVLGNLVEKNVISLQDLWPFVQKHYQLMLNKNMNTRLDMNEISELVLDFQSMSVQNGIQDMPLIMENTSHYNSPLVSYQNEHKMDGNGRRERNCAVFLPPNREIFDHNSCTNSMMVGDQSIDIGIQRSKIRQRRVAVYNGLAVNDVNSINVDENQHQHFFQNAANSAFNIFRH